MRLATCPARVAEITMPSENGISTSPASVAETPLVETRKSGTKMLMEMKAAPKKNVARVARRKTGSENRRGSRIGPSTARERRTKATSRIADTASRPGVAHNCHPADATAPSATAGADASQGSQGLACLSICSASTSGTRPPTRRPAPAKSGRVAPGGASRSGIRRRMCHSAIPPMGMLTRKTQRQPAIPGIQLPAWSVSSPPSSGPMTEETPNTAPTYPWYLPRSAGVKRSAMTMKVMAKMPPAPIPWTPREITSWLMPSPSSGSGPAIPARPQATEPARKRPTAARVTCLRA